MCGRLRKGDKEGMTAPRGQDARAEGLKTRAFILTFQAQSTPLLRLPTPGYKR